MALLSKTKSAAEPFRLPSLAEVSPDYAGLLAKQADLQNRQIALGVERRRLEKDIAADPSRELRPSIAELLGDQPGTKALNRKRLAEIVAEIGDLEAALAVLRQRLTDARGKASTAVCAAAKPEYARRVAAMVDAMQALDAAHREYDQLRFAFEAEDVSWGSLIPMTPAFLGDSGDPERRLARFVREARGAGYGC